ncbi:MAG: NADH-quinone oxidoreductase subunit J [Gammaproteobacteria bacterium]
MIELMFFSGFAFVLVCSSIGVITSRNPVYSAMFLVLAFVTSAALWLLLEAEFLAMTLVLVYVGAVMVLFLFVVMMLDVEVSSKKASFTRFAPLGFLVAGIAFAEIFVVFWLRNQGFPVLQSPTPHGPDFSDTKELGAVLYTEYVYPFELAAFVLLLAIVAAIVLTMRRRPGLKVQNIAAQVAVKRDDRVRLVKMEPERD